MKETGLTGESAGNQASKYSSGVFYGNGPIPMSDTMSLLAGLFLLLLVLPGTVVVVGLTVLWDAVDRGFMGNPQDGVVCSLARWLNRVSAPFCALFVKQPEDAFLVNLFLLIGIFVPSMFAASLYYTLHFGFSLPLCLVYHVIRLGPYFMNFAYAYTICHKEGHSRQGLWVRWLNPLMRNAFNWWVGLFYGVMPSSFAFGHSINHHKYNNGPLDVISTSDRPRDSFLNWVRYLPRFVLYALNISTARQFVYEGEYFVAFKMVLGSAWCWLFAFAVYRLSPLFALMYIIFPIGENILLLACVNWCWHAFIDPDAPDNTYVGSLTLFNGPINVLQEDFHVVHHQYPGAHWTTHPLKYKQHVSKGHYRDHAATAFSGTHVFELFFIIILKDYKMMASKFVDMSGRYPSTKDKQVILKQRLQSCWWGPHAKGKQYQQAGWEGVESIQRDF
jgi:hypothetical protein